MWLLVFGVVAAQCLQPSDLVLADDQAKVSRADAQASIASAKALSIAFRDASARMLPSVVTIRTRMPKEETERGILDVLEGDEHDTFETVGSGVIISADGLIITNNHVVERARDVQVELSNGVQLAAKDIRTDRASDLAILRAVTDKKLPPAEIADSDELMVGDWVLAIGSPFALQSTVSAGIISGKGRGLGRVQGQPVRGQFLQTDAAINPGNSGGPLVNLEGKVIGINTAISSATGTFNGVGFAIPIKRAFWITSELVEHGKVRRAMLGVRTNSIPQDLLDKLDIANSQGAYVDSVVGDPAAKAGIQSGDLIVELDNVQVASHTALPDIVEQCPIGKPLKLIVQRDGKRIELTVELIPAVDRRR